jgi:hypothetical protein
VIQGDLFDLQRTRNRQQSDVADVVAAMARPPVVPTCIHGYPMLPGQMACCPACQADVEAAVARELEREKA